VWTAPGPRSSVLQSPNRRGDTGLEDLAPTTLNVFGMDPPAWMEGKQILDLASA
jgi:bisphosphoglycerate-independent phosphoglycerate mutase (AlkP superfamily)